MTHIEHFERGRIRPVLKMGNPLLRVVAEEVSEPTSEETQHLINDMFATMHDAQGTGLAAPQIGVSKRIIVFMITSERAAREGTHPEPLIGLVNPVIQPLTDEKVDGWEGCLSVPGVI
jgi:peptide deformylase